MGRSRGRHRYRTPFKTHADPRYWGIESLRPSHSSNCRSPPASITHIVALFDSGAAGERLYYVMPYVQGESLRARLEREQQLTIEDALRLTREIASALGHAHQHGLVHRDIKPENILLADGIALVADFGIAQGTIAAGAGRLIPFDEVMATALDAGSAASSS